MLFSGYPQPQYKWLKNGEVIRDLSTEQFLRLQSMRLSDAGVYQCVAQNDVGAIFSDKVELSIAHMGEFEDLSERTVSVESGQSVTLQLPYIESNPPPAAKWYDDEGKVLYGQKYAITKDGQLIILSSDKSDEKSYRASAFNSQSGKEEYSPFITLKVHGDSYTEIAPEIIVKPESSNVTMGTQEFNLYCIANAR